MNAEVSVELRRIVAAKEMLQEFVRSATEHRDILGTLFGRALLGRLGGEIPETANIYLRSVGRPQIELFNAMATRFPPIAASGRIANGLMTNAICKRSKVALLDIGIGTGRQELALLKTLQGANVREIDLVAIEPAETSLEEAGRVLRAESEKLGIALGFTGIQRRVEEVTDQEWRKIAERDEILVNAAFALHHIAGSGDSPKNRVLRKIRELDPLAFVLIEPDSDHHSPDLDTRFTNAWQHFGLVFRMIDSMGFSPSDSDAIKSGFFAREIDDIVGNPNEESRTERHESANMWLSRLKHCGFRTRQDLLEQVHPMSDGLLKVIPADERISLAYEGRPLVTLLCAS